MNQQELKSVTTAFLEISYFEIGPATGEPVILLHGFPYDVHAYTDVCARLADRGFRCLVPYLRGYGSTRFLSPETMRSGQQAALAHDLLAFMDALSIPKALLGGYDWGGRAACILAALWPDRVKGLVSCGLGYNIQDIPNAVRPVPPEEETRYWYIYLFNTERGRQTLIENRKALCRFIWSHWSPSWNFSDTDYDASATSFENPDFVEIVIHSYRHRLGEVSGNPVYEETEIKLSKQPKITVPTIILQGRDDTVDPPTPEDTSSKHFSGFYKKQIIDGVGHNLPQEAPEAFVLAVLTLAGQ